MFKPAMHIGVCSLEERGEVTVTVWAEKPRPKHDRNGEVSSIW